MEKETLESEEFIALLEGAEKQSKAPEGEGEGEGSFKASTAQKDAEEKRESAADPMDPHPAGFVVSDSKPFIMLNYNYCHDLV